MIKLISVFILFASLLSGAYSKSSGDEITPYGAYCPLCGEYGYCTKQPTKKEITDALKSYYSKKGLMVVLIKHDGRFAEAEVYKNKKMVDKILLDCRTGRIRSIDHIHQPHPHRHKQYAKVKNPIPMSEESINKGRELFERHCTTCHENARDKNTDLSDDLWIHGNSDGEIYHVILHGAKGTSMKGFKKELTKEMRWHLVNYIKSIRKE